jgi:hypothetical protein
VFTSQGDSAGRYHLVTDDAMSMKYISRMRQKLKSGAVPTPTPASHKQHEERPSQKPTPKKQEA